MQTDLYRFTTIKKAYLLFLLVYFTLTFFHYILTQYPNSIWLLSLALESSKLFSLGSRVDTSKVFQKYPIFNNFHSMIFNKIDVKNFFWKKTNKLKKKRKAHECNPGCPSSNWNTVRMSVSSQEATLRIKRDTLSLCLPTRRRKSFIIDALVHANYHQMAIKRHPFGRSLSSIPLSP